MSSNLDRVCYFCHKTFLSPAHLLLHMATHTKETPFFCSICSKGFSLNENLKRHTIRHTNNGRGQTQTEFKNYCKFCGKRFLFKYKLNQHILSHTQEKNFQCSICKQGFTQNDSLRQHVKLVHDKIRAFNCPQCEKTFGTKGSLKRHLIVHSGARDFQCSKCLKFFGLLSNLDIHIKRVHLGEKSKYKQIENLKFACYFCQKKFWDNSKLEEHMRIHTKETPFFCNFCSKGFSRISTLKNHKKTHLSEEEKVNLKLGYKYTCKICQKRFPTQVNLHRHILSHTKEKLFNCKICKTGFTEMGNLNKHNKTVHQKLQQ